MDLRNGAGGKVTLNHIQKAVHNNFCDVVSCAASSGSQARLSWESLETSREQNPEIDGDKPLEEVAADGARGGSDRNGSGNGRPMFTGQCSLATVLRPAEGASCLTGDTEK